MKPLAPWLLRLAPRPFRERFGDEILLDYADLCREAAGRGPLARLAAALGGLFDIARTGCAERCSQMEKTTRAAYGVAFALALGLGWFDTHVVTDDTGIVAGIVLACAFVPGVMAPRHALCLGPLVGLGVPLAHLALGSPRGYEAFLALLPATIGALLGAGARKIGGGFRRA